MNIEIVDPPTFSICEGNEVADLEYNFDFGYGFGSVAYDPSLDVGIEPCPRHHANVGYASMVMRKFAGQRGDLSHTYLFTCACDWKTARGPKMYAALIHHAFMECPQLLENLMPRLSNVLSSLPMKPKIDWRHLPRPIKAEHDFNIVLAELLATVKVVEPKKRFNALNYMKHYGYKGGALKLGGLEECLPVPSQEWTRNRFGVGGDIFSRGARIMTTIDSVLISRIPFVRGDPLFPPSIREVGKRNHYYSRVYWERLLQDLQTSTHVPINWKPVHKISDPDFFPLPHLSHPPYQI